MGRRSREHNSVAAPRPRAVGHTFPAWKFAAPQLLEVEVPRKRLIALLERHLGRLPRPADVVLVNAPPGYGKTTLLAQWAAHTTLPTLWYHLDLSDSDPATLLYGLIHVLRTRAPRGQWEVRGLLSHLHVGALAPADLRRAAAVFAADIRRHITKPTVLILTGIDHLESNGGARAVIEHLLARTPDELRLVLEYRELAPLRLSTALVQRRVESITGDDLQFTGDELSALLAARGIAAGDDYIERLSTLCDGWVAGALLAAGGLWSGNMASHVGDELNREEMFDYLAREVLDHLPPDLYDFAVDAAVLNYMTVPLCRDLLGVPDARQRLAALERLTGMISHVGLRPQEPVYRFQPLLREVLIEHLTARYGSAALRERRLRAGWLLERADDPEAAAQQYAQAGAADALVTLIETCRAALLRAGRGATLARWIDLLTPADRAAYPHLLILQAELYRARGQTADAERTIEQACAEVLPAAAQMPLIAARALLVRADVGYIRGHYAQACRDCERALALLPPEEDELRVQCHFVLAACLNVSEGPVAAKASLDGVEERCARLGDLWALARLHYLRAMLAHSRGAYLEAESALTVSLRYAQEAGDEVRGAACRLYLGAIHQHLGQPDVARRELEAALEQSEMIGHLQGQAYALMNLADLDVSLGRHEAAFELYARSQALEKRLDDHHLRCLNAAGASRALALSGSAPAAIEHLTASLRETADGHAPQDCVLLQTTLGFVLYYAGQLDRAKAALESVIPVALEHDMLAECAQAYLTLAATRLLQERTSAAEATLLLAFELARRIDNTAVALLDARHLPALFPVVARIRHPLAVDLLARLGTSQPAIASAYAKEEGVGAEQPIRVFALGEMRVLVGDRRLTRWPRPQMRELLLFLLDRNASVRFDQIRHAIWPEKNEEVAQREFSRVRSALKQAFGRPCIQQRESRWSLAFDCWLDAREFMRLASEGARLARSGDVEAAASVLRQALALWGGPYLDDFGNGWAIGRRVDLQMHYIEVLDQLAALELQLGHHDAAARLCFQLLDEDPLFESAHRVLMAFYAARGEYPKAVAQYARLCALLREQPDLRPSPQTQALYESLRAKTRHDAYAPALRAPTM
jgi:ATP/maltotriose-dependent transcriptional regulator MalT/DNA-binding SARP family transcriptional activator